jgi:hypothetical protein
MQDYKKKYFKYKQKYVNLKKQFGGIILPVIGDRTQNSVTGNLRSIKQLYNLDTQFASREELSKPTGDGPQHIITRKLFLSDKYPQYLFLYEDDDVGNYTVYYRNKLVEITNAELDTFKPTSFFNIGLTNPIAVYPI